MNDVRAYLGQDRDALDTPALLVDLDVLEANIARIAAACRAQGVNWRPHIKGVKSPALVRLEIEAGAIGVTCAKLGEAEVMAAAGITDILVANQIVGAQKIARLMALLDRAEVKVAVDSIENVRALAAAARDADRTLGVVIEVDTGMHRAGVEPGEAVVALARTIAAEPGLRFMGVMGWEAHATSVADPAEKERTVAAAVGRLAASAEACRAAGLEVEIVSCGGTGTFPICARQPGITEIQAGGGVFSDVMYRRKFNIDLPAALSVLATVTSRPTPTRVILDAGKKTMSSDAAVPEPRGLPPAQPVRLSAEHATIELNDASPAPAIGQKVELLVGYSDTTVHLHETIFGLRGGKVEAVFPVAARGKLQ